MTIKEVSEKYKIPQDTLRYYERAGMIPPVTRTAGGIRNYTPEDLRWVEHTICMRSAGLPVETMAQYVALFQQGDETIPQRLELLLKQRQSLVDQKAQIEATLDRLAIKIERYQAAIETGVLSWHKEDH